MHRTASTNQSCSATWCHIILPNTYTSSPIGGHAHIDEDIPITYTSSTPSMHENNQEPEGPMTRARAKRLNKQVLLFLRESSITLDENSVLPNANMLCVLRFEAMEEKGWKGQS